MFSTCVHTQLIYTRILTHVPHAQPHPQRVHTPNAHVHAVTLTPCTGQHMHSCGLHTHTHTLSQESVRGAQCGVWAPEQPAAHISAASTPGPVFVQLFPLPQAPRGGRKRSRGEGAGHSGPNQEFHTPKGTRPLCKAPLTSWGEAQSWLCSQAAGDHGGPHSGRAPSPFRGLGSRLSLEGFCAWVLPAPAGCPAAEDQQAPNGPQRTLHCPFPGLISGRVGGDVGPDTSASARWAPSETEHM